MSMLAQIIKQAEAAAALLEKSSKVAQTVRGLRSGDRVFTPLIQSAEFDQGSAPSATLVFNVPADADFWAYRFSIYPFCKVVDPVNGTPDEVVFRPTSFAGQSASAGRKNATIAYTDFNSCVDGTFAFISDSEELQNAEIPMAAAYSVDLGKWSPSYNRSFTGSVWGGASQTPGGLVFDIPVFIPRTKSLSVRLTPTYLGVRSIVESVEIDGVPTDITRRHRYKIVAVLEGEKKVSAFR